MDIRNPEKTIFSAAARQDARDALVAPERVLQLGLVPDGDERDVGARGGLLRGRRDDGS